MRYYHIYDGSAGASYTIRYSYVCEGCGHEIHAEHVESAYADNRITYTTPEDLETTLNKISFDKRQLLAATLKGQMAKAEKGDYGFLTEICPDCGETQSFSLLPAWRYVVRMAAGVIFALATLALVWVFVSANMADPESSGYWLPALVCLALGLSAGGVFIYRAIMGLRLLRRSTKDGRTPVLPEVCFPGEEDIVLVR